jgi:hypothetical protein
MAVDGAGTHTTSARVLAITVAVAARSGVMSKRSTRAGGYRFGCRTVTITRSPSARASSVLEEMKMPVLKPSR